MQKINDSVKKMTLNVNNREAFTDIIIKDAFKSRSDKLRFRYHALILDMAKRTWGKTPQQQAVNKKLANDTSTQLKKLKDKGVAVSDTTVGLTNLYRIELNASGQKWLLNASLTDDINERSVFDFTHVLRGSHCQTIEVRAASSLLTLIAGDPLIKELHAIRDESNDLKNAADEFKAILNTVFGKSRTLGVALEKWEGLANYVPLILSNSREIVVTGPVLDKRISALRSGKVSVKEAMSIGKAE